MKNKFNQKGLAIAIGVGIVVLMLIISAYANSKSQSENISMDKTNDEPGQMMEDVKDDEMMEAKHVAYVDYFENSFAAASGKKRVYFFYATWCPTCKASNADIVANLDKIPEGVVVFKTDYDKETKLKKQYGITYQHTFVQVDANGNEIAKWNGGGVFEIVKNIK